MTSAASGAEPERTSRTGPSRSSSASTPAPVREHRRRDRHHAARLVLDQVEGALRVEPLGQHQLGPVAQHAAEHRVETVDVEERQHAEHDVVAVDHRRLDGRDLLQVGDERAMGQHHRPGQARGAARVEQHRELLGIAQRQHLARLGGPEVVVRLLVGLDRGADDDRAQRPVVGLPDLRHSRPHGGDGLGIGDDHAGSRVGQHPGELAGRGPRVDGHGDSLRAQDTEVGRHELQPVAESQQDPVPGHDPGRPEAARDPAHLDVELGPGHAATTGLDDREPIACLGCGGPHERSHVGRQTWRRSYDGARLAERVDRLPAWQRPPTAPSGRT